MALASLAGTALLPVTLLFVPSAVPRERAGGVLSPQEATLDLDPHSIPLPIWPAVLDVAFFLLPLGMVVPFVVIAVRYRRARGRRRLQLRWLVWAGLDVLAIGVGLLFGEPVPTLALIAAITVTCGAVVVAVVRERLYDIDRLLPTTVVAVALGLLVLAVDALVLLVAGAAFWRAGLGAARGGRRRRALHPAALPALARRPAAHARVPRRPLRRRLHPRRVARSAAVAPGEQLAALARSVAEAFKLPYVRVEIDRADGARAVVEHGHTDRLTADRTADLPIRYRNETIGRVAVAEGPRLSESDQRLLGDLAPAGRGGRAGRRADRRPAAARGRRWSPPARRSGGGCGATCTTASARACGAVTLRIETARNLAGRDPRAADAVLEQAVGRRRAPLADVRRLVHDLRPPALDELGLVGALRSRHAGGSGDDLEVDVDGDRRRCRPRSRWRPSGSPRRR